MSSLQVALIGGAVGFALLLVVVLSGLKVIRIGFKAHRALGLVLLGLATLHGLGALLMYLGLF